MTATLAGRHAPDQDVARRSRRIMSENRTLRGTQFCVVS